MRKFQKITKFLHHTFFPTEHNKNVPHILRKSSVFILATLALGLFLFDTHNFKISQRLNLSALVYPSVLVDLANQERNREGLNTLAWNAKLAQAAREKALDMLERDYFAHTSPEGITPWYWLSQAKYNFVYAGENLAIRFDDSEDVQDAWLDSPTHRANIMSSKFSEIGIAAVDGVFEGKETTVVVQFFATPAFVPVFTPPPPTPTATPVSAPPAAPSPVVAGTDTEDGTVKKPSTPKKVSTPETTPPVETLEESQTYIVVKSAEPYEAATVLENLKSMSKWYERLIVNPTPTVRSIYLMLIAVVLASMILMLFKEYEKHHLKHFMMGLCLVFVVGFLLYFIGPGSLYLA